MEADSSFADLMDRLHQGAPAAAADIFERYASRLVRLASPRLVGMIRQKVDAEDLVQSAFKSFFRANSQTSFALDGWSDLWALLATITLRKCRRQVRALLTTKRDITRERAAAARDDSHASWEAVAKDPSPEEAAALSDLINAWLQRLDEKGRQIAELALQGQSAEQIAPQVGLTERSVYRQMERIRNKLRDLDDH